MRRLHAIAREHGVDHDTLHALAVQDYNAGSMTELSVTQLEEMSESVQMSESEALAREVDGISDSADVSPVDELLARVYAATTLDHLDAIRAEKNSTGINDQTLSDAWRSRFLELGGKGKPKSGTLELAVQQQRAAEAVGV